MYFECSMDVNEKMVSTRNMITEANMNVFMYH